MPPGIPFGVVSDGAHATGKQAVIYMHQHWIRRWILEDQIGSLINTIEHESTHANQKNQSTTEFADNNDVMEFEAYTHEILLVDQKAKTGSAPLPTQAQLRKAYQAAEGHLNGLRTSLTADEQLKYNQAWVQVEQVYPDLLEYLDRRDERRGASRAEEERFGEALQRHLALGERLAELEQAGASQYGGEFGALDSLESAAYLQVLGAHQELHDAAKKRVEPTYEKMEKLHEAFGDYRRRGPRRSKAAKSRSQPASSSGGLGGIGLPPPSGFLPPPPSFGLPPPPSFGATSDPQPGFSSAFATDFGSAFGDDFEFGDFQGAEMAKKSDHHDEVEDAVEFGDYQGAETAKKGDDEDDLEFGDFQGAAPAKKNDDEDDLEFGDFQGAAPASTTGGVGGTF